MTDHNTKDKKKKTSSEIAVEIRESEREYQAALEESKKAIEIEEKRLKAAAERNTEFKYAIVQRMGKMLERSGLVQVDRISTRITHDFKGYIARLTVQNASESRWKRQYTTPPDHGRHTRKYKIDTVQAETTELTQQEREYVKAHEDEYKRETLLNELIELWTGTDSEAQGAIIQQTPKGSDWRKRLITQSKDHMIKLAKQMTDTYVNGTYNDMRMVSMLASAFGDVLYEERELRERKKKIEGI